MIIMIKAPQAGAFIIREEMKMEESRKYHNILAPSILSADFKHLGQDLDDIKRKLEYLEMIGAIKRVSVFSCDGSHCTECAVHSHSGKDPCKGCLPDGGFKNMGEMWEVVSS